MEGAPLWLEWRGRMRAYRGRIEIQAGRGEEVHAASFIRERRLAFDRALTKNQPELERIGLHEIFHFVWARLGNPWRRKWELLLRGELNRGARGELGWSSEWRKRKLAAADVTGRTRRWREYVCESFCDSAAWMYGRLAEHEEFTLARRFLPSRRTWFRHWAGHQRGGVRI